MVSALATGANFALPQDVKDQIIQNVIDEVTDSYSEHYQIIDISASIAKVENTGAKIIVDIEVDFVKVLKAESASDVPYLCGLESKLQEITDPTEKMLLEQKIDIVRADLEEFYIGQPQKEWSAFRYSLDLPQTRTFFQNNLSDAVNNAEIIFVDEFDNEYDISVFEPDTAQELEKQGVEDAIAIVQSEPSISLMANTNARNYNRIAARNYARDYALKYNKSYSVYSGNDCANFVSQALYAAGIPTTTTWRADSLTWIRAREVESYMVNQGYFWHTKDKYSAFAGSIIAWTDIQHVGIVDQNDYTTMTYCVHTNDRLSASFKTLSNVQFAVPEWDSYAGQWSR